MGKAWWQTGVAARAVIFASPVPRGVRPVGLRRLGLIRDIAKSGDMCGELKKQCDES